MSADTNKLIKSAIPKSEILKAFKENTPDRMEEIMYETADHDSLFPLYIDLDLPTVLYKICEESIRFLLETENKEKALGIFKDVLENIAYIETTPIPDKFFEQFYKY